MKKLTPRKRPRDNKDEIYKSEEKESTPYSNSSSGSDSYGFQTNKNQEVVNIKYERVKNFAEFKNKLNSIEEPCTLDNLDFLDFLDIEKDNEDSKKIPIKSFDLIKKENIIHLDNLKSVRDFFDNQTKKNKIIFSSKIFQVINDQINIDLNIFQKIHDYMTGFCGGSKISDFCYLKELYFPNSHSDIYYEINRDFTKNFRSHHTINGMFWKIDYHFGISGGGKSISSRAIIHNYMHFNLVSGYNVFYPTIFFDIKIINNSITEREKLFKIIKYETMGLFDKYDKWEQYLKKVKEIIEKNYSTFDIIMKILEDISSKIEINKVAVVLDHFSEEYDPKFGNLNKIREFCLKNSKFYFYVIFDIKNINDQIFFFDWFKNNINFPEEERNHDLDNNEASIYHKYDFKNLNDMKKYLKDIPDEYSDYFDQNISYYFKYMNYKKEYPLRDFDNFIEDEKEIIKENLNNYIGSIDHENYATKLIKIKDYLNCWLEERNVPYNNSIFKYFPTSYFIYSKNVKNNTYSINPAFPLVEDCLNEIYETFNEYNFIDIRNEEFLKLEGQPMGTIFDVYMNIWLKKKAKTRLFQFDGKDIEIIKIKSVIRKNQPNKKIEQLYFEEEIEKEIDKNKELSFLKERYKNLKKSKKCIIIFQGFCAKSIDVYFLIKKNENNEFFINCIQMKCSDEYVIDDNLASKNPYEMTYVKHKIEILFNIKILASYITYMSIKEKPKKCAENNKSKFFLYCINNNNFVDFDGNEINELPFYKDCFVNFIETEEILNVVRYQILRKFKSIKFNIKKISDDDIKKINNNDNIIKVKETLNETIANYNIKQFNSELKYTASNKNDNIIKYYKIEIIHE